ncbi:MAG: hypothetical protein M4579_000581 [Chaenotheca gracillima]|nr:MAG: hypothetical protein M4579_000581 [Chaenotheca gracillima]
MNQNVPRKLLITFDAFGTLFVPRLPIARQYGEVAATYGLSGFSEQDLQKSFRKAFKEEAKLRPNYGKASGMRAPEWWANIIRATFNPFLPRSQTTDLPNGLVHDLLVRFSSSDGYTLCPDVLPLLNAIRETKQRRPYKRTEAWPWDLTVVGVVTNSDDRVPSILKSLGVDIGTRTVGNSKDLKSSELDKDISFTVMSYDVGEEKPHPLILHSAEELLQDTLRAEGLMDPELGGARAPKLSKQLEDFHYVHVGDDKKDVEAAKNAGWNSIWLDRDGVDTRNIPEGPEGAKQTIIARDLSRIHHWRPEMSSQSNGP